MPSETELNRELETCRRLYAGFRSAEPLLRDLWLAVGAALRDEQNLTTSRHDTARVVLNETADVLSTHEPRLGSRVQYLSGLLEQHINKVGDPILLEPSALMSAYASAAQSVPERDLLSLMTTLLGSALYGAGAKLYAGADAPEQGSATLCPACGQRPHYAAHSFASGTKIFECPLCFTRWQYARLKCPYCGNSDTESLGYFSVEGLDRCRVQFCSRCQTYHKVFDFKEVEGEDHVLYLHHLASLVCDTMACLEGFSPCSGLWWNDASALDVATGGEELL